MPRLLSPSGHRWLAPAVIAAIVGFVAPQAHAAVFDVPAGDTSTLIADINSANGNGEANTIELTKSTYSLTAPDNDWYGPDGLPAISSTLTIDGNGATITRAATAAPFRLLYVSGGQSGLPAGDLTLQDLTLSGGQAQGGSSNDGGAGAGMGGAIFDQGTVTLQRVTLSGNDAQGGDSGTSTSAGGGGIGENAPTVGDGDGGGFGGSAPGAIGGAGGDGSGEGAGGGGGGFAAGDAGGNGGSFIGGAGGGQGGFGGAGGAEAAIAGAAGDGGGGGSYGGPAAGGNGGGFGDGGRVSGGGGGAGGIGGGGAAGGGAGGGGGFGGGGGTSEAGGIGGAGGFGAGGGSAFGATGGAGGFGGGAGSGTTGGAGAGMGGAVFVMFGELTVRDSTLTGNAAAGGTVTGGGAGDGDGLGGAIFNLDAELSLSGATVTSNAVSGGSPGGAGIYSLAYGNTIDADAAQSATVESTGSILYGNTGTDLTVDSVDGNNTNTSTATLNGANVVGTSSGTISGAAPITSNPQLGPLQDNGGPGMATTAPAAGSPAIGAGVTCDATDERGIVRPATGCDLGAVETTHTAPTVTIASPADGARYAQGQVVITSYACAQQQGPGIDSCAGTVRDGAAIDTSTPGTFMFTVTATTVDGLTASRSVRYTVVAASSVPVSPLPPVDLRIVKHVNRRVADVGQTLSYTLTIKNNGPGTAPNVTIADTPSIAMRVLSTTASQGDCTRQTPLRCALGALTSGRTATITIRAVPRHAGIEINTARVSAGCAGSGNCPPDSNPHNDVSRARTRVRPYLELTDTVDQRVLQAGQRATYRLKLTDPTTVAVTHVRVCDRLALGIVYLSARPRATLAGGRVCWSYRRLAAHRSTTIRLAARTLAGASGRLTNRATATAKGARGAKATSTVRVLAAPIPTPTPVTG